MTLAPGRDADGSREGDGKFAGVSGTDLCRRSRPPRRRKPRRPDARQAGVRRADDALQVRRGPQGARQREPAQADAKNSGQHTGNEKVVAP